MLTLIMSLQPARMSLQHGVLGGTVAGLVLAMPLPNACGDRGWLLTALSAQEFVNVDSVDRPLDIDHW